MLTRRLSGILLLTCVAVMPALPAATLPDFKASYELNRGNLRIGTATISLHTGGNGNYLYESRSWPTRWVA